MSLANDVIIQRWAAILAQYEEYRRRRIAGALRRLCENLRHLDGRSRDWWTAAQALSQWDVSAQGVPTFDELQHIYVDRVEAFHQQVYSTLGAFAMALNRMRQKSAPDYPPADNSKVLKRLENDFKDEPQLIQDLATLGDSREFRSKYVDHVATSTLLNWTTYGWEGRRYHILYSDLQPGEVPSPRPQPWDPDPRSPNFWPPIECGEFKVAPDEIATYEALQRVVIAAIQRAAHVKVGDP
jgi:hypothetical protein